MLFSSITFAIFLLPYLLIHRITPPRYRNYVIIAGSLIFYGWWKPEHLWIPILLIAIAFTGSKAITNSHDSKQKPILILTIIALCTPLLFFKYFNFLFRSFSSLIGITFPERADSIAIPLGISFITFTLIAFLIDTYKKRIKYKIGPASFASYVLFFPQLVAGPILRPDQLLPQLTRPKPSRWRMRSILVAAGIFALGLTKKIIIADQVAAVVDPVYASSTIPSFQDALLALYGFSTQIYCDFSGYIDMATAVALILGVKLPINFRQPYTSFSLSDFWRRWHITLSNWLRDYLYIPLGGNRHGQTKQARNLLTTMAIGGIWHGANWTFVLWGILQGIGLTISHRVNKAVAGKNMLIRSSFIFLTFHLVSFLWIFFRASSIDQAMTVIQGLASWQGTDINSTTEFINNHLFYILLIAVFMVTHHLDDQRRIALLMRKIRVEIAIPALLFIVMMCGVISQGSSGSFIYFEF